MVARNPDLVRLVFEIDYDGRNFTLKHLPPRDKRVKFPLVTLSDLEDLQRTVNHRCRAVYLDYDFAVSFVKTKSYLEKVGDNDPIQ